MFFYSDQKQPFSGSPSAIWEMDGTRQYLQHYDNMLYLKFVANNSRASFQERAQAEKEMKICQRKLDFWQRHPNYDKSRAMQGCLDLKKKWES